MKGARGFSLVEVMVAVLVICVGLLGIAKMQALALSNTTTSRLRALAAIQAASLASAMHSNREYWASPAPPANTTFNGNTNPQFVSTDAALAVTANADYTAGGGNLNAINQCVGTLGSGTVCSPPTNGTTNLAGFDLARWGTSLTQTLPNPQAQVQCSVVAGGNSPAQCTILITWTEKAVGLNAQEQTNPGNSAMEQPNYMVYVEP